MADRRESRAVLVRLRSLGDTVLMTPCLEAIARRPGWKAAVVVEPPYDQVLENNPFIDRLFIVSGSGKWSARLKVVRQIRAYRPELVVDLHGGTTSSIITRLSGAAVRAGYASGRNSRFYSVAIEDSRRIWGKESIHTVEHQLAPLKALGFPCDAFSQPRVPVLPNSLERVRGLLSGTGVTGDFVLVHPAAAFDTKQWPAVNFVELLNTLVRETALVVTAGPGQEPLLEEIQRFSNPSIVFVHPLRLCDFTALASLCRLYLGNDTGPTHIAASLGKKVVVIWGSSDWRVWHPWGVEHRLLKADLDCIPCPGYSCHLYDEPRCIQSIDVERVLQAVREMMATKG